MISETISLLSFLILHYVNINKAFVIDLFHKLNYYDRLDLISGGHLEGSVKDVSRNYINIMVFNYILC